MYLIHSANHYHSAPISLSLPTISSYLIPCPNVAIYLSNSGGDHTDSLSSPPPYLVYLGKNSSAANPWPKKDPKKDPIQQVKMLTKLQKKETLTMRTINVLLC